MGSKGIYLEKEPLDKVAASSDLKEPLIALYGRIPYAVG